MVQKIVIRLDFLFHSRKHNERRQIAARELEEVEDLHLLKTRGSDHR